MTSLTTSLSGFLLFLMLGHSGICAQSLEKKELLSHYQKLQNMLTPQIEKKWFLSKITLASATGALVASLAYAACKQQHTEAMSMLQKNGTPEQKNDPFAKTKEKLKQLKGVVHNMAQEQQPLQATPTVLDAKNIEFLEKIFYHQSLITGIALYLGVSSITHAALSSFFDRMMRSHKATLINFLAQWPENSAATSQSLQDEISGLYGIWREQGTDVVIKNEQTAQLILIALQALIAHETHTIIETL